VDDMILKGRIIGFEEYDKFLMQEAFGEASPFRILACHDAPISFVVANPYFFVEDYALELEDDALRALHIDGTTLENIAVLCIVRPDKKTLYVNFRSPLIMNIKDGVFLQVVLQNEAYGVSVPFTINEG